MPKHLTTLPHGTALPDPTTVPDGYPFLLEAGAGPATTRMLYQNQGGSWKVAGGGGGGGGGAVMYGPLAPVPAGKDGTAPDWWITPDASADNDQGNSPSVSWYHTSNDTTVPAKTDPAGTALAHSWTLGVNAGLEDTDYDFLIRMPGDYGPGGTDPSVGLRAQRLDFRMWLPSYNNMFVLMVTDAYEYTDVYRQVPVWSAVDEHDALVDPATTSYYGGGGNPPDYNTALWARKGGRAAWVDYSVTIPNGASSVQFIVWHDGGYDPAVQGYPKITDIRGTYLDDSFDNGTMFVELTTGNIWLLDKSVKFPSKADADANNTGNNGGGGWYRVVRGPLLDDGGTEFEPMLNGNKYHIGNSYFSDLFDLSGAQFGKKKYAQIGVDYAGTLPSMAGQPVYDDNFIRPNQLLDDGYYDYLFGGQQSTPYVVVGAGVMDPPVAPVVNTGFGARASNSVFDGVASFYYQTTYLTNNMAHTGFGANTAVSPTSGAITPSSSQIVKVNVPAFGPGVDQVQVWRSTSAGGVFSLVDTINPGDLGTAKAPFDFSQSTWTYIDGGAPTQAQAAPAADSGTVDVGLFETGLVNMRADTSVAPYAVVLVDGGAANNTMTLTWGINDTGSALFSANHPLGVWFRSDGTDANGFIYRLTPGGGGAVNWSLIDRNANVETTIASGTFTPSNAGIQKLTLTVAGTTSHLVYTDDTGDHDVHNAADLTANHAASTFYGLRNGPANPLRRFQLAASTNVLPCVETQLGHLFPDMGAAVPYGAQSGNGGRMSAVTLTAARKPLNGKSVRVRAVRWDLSKGNRRVLHEVSEVAVLGSSGSRAQAIGLGSSAQTHNAGDVIQMWAVYSKQNWVEPAPLELAATLTYGES